MQDVLQGWGGGDSVTFVRFYFQCGQKERSSYLEAGGL